jgi:hypothetical protein
VNGMNFPPGRPYCPHYRGGLGPARHPSGCGALPPTPSACSSTLQPSQLTGAAYLVGLANRPDLQAKVEM